MHDNCMLFIADTRKITNNITFVSIKEFIIENLFVCCGTKETIQRYNLGPFFAFAQIILSD